MKNIEAGKIYFIHDGSKTGHPGYIVWKDDNRNRYLVIRFDSDKIGEVPKKDRGVKHITRLSHPTEKGIVNSYVHNRPMLCKRKDIGKEKIDMHISKEDYKIIFKISKKPIEYSPSTRKNKKTDLAY